MVLLTKSSKVVVCTYVYVYLSITKLASCERRKGKTLSLRKWVWSHWGA